MVGATLFYSVMFLLTQIAVKTDNIAIEVFTRRNILRSLPALFLLLLTVLLISLLEKPAQDIDPKIFLIKLYEYFLLVAFSEEYMFRGYLHNALGRDLGLKGKLYDLLVLCGISSHAFAASHIPTDLLEGNNAVYFIVTMYASRFVSGFFFSLQYTVSDNLLIPILSHGFADLTIFYFPIRSIPFHCLIEVMPLLVSSIVYRKSLRSLIPHDRPYLKNILKATMKKISSVIGFVHLPDNR